MQLRKFVALGAAFGLFAAATGAAGSPPPRKPVDLVLRAGQAVFWNGEHVESSSGSESWNFALKLKESGYRLRIGLDHPEIGDYYEVEVVGPGGVRAGSFSPGDSLYSAEFIESRPKPGIWRITVTAEDVTDSAFRMRAKLEARPPAIGSGKDLVLPNLQVLPPHEVSFLAPLSNGTTPGEPQGADLAGAGSCHPEEHAEDHAVRCLRFAFGIRNTGKGPMQLYYEGQPPDDHPLYQRVLRADGSYFDREAGIARYHESHVHYHHNDAAGLQLWHVTDPETGEMEAVTPKRTKGFAHRDELLRDWHHFYPTINKFGFGLKPGWADIYEWDRPGNYIDFGINGDGRYVVRMWADPVDGILESNDRDNAGYTYLEVSGTTVTLLEAGRGKHPWDPCKILVGFGGHPDPKSPRRPKSCPPDTT